MFKIDNRAMRHALSVNDSVESLARRALEELHRQLRADPRGVGLPEDLGEALEVLLASHKAMAEAGEEMPSADELGDIMVATAPTRPSVRVLDRFRPTIARLRRERDEARAKGMRPSSQEDVRSPGQVAYEAWGRNGVSFAYTEPDEQALWERVARAVQAEFASCSDPPSIGIGDPPPKPPPPPPSVVAEPCDEEFEARHRQDWTSYKCTRPKGHEGGHSSC